jgi:hypothetical protein
MFLSVSICNYYCQFGNYVLLSEDCRPSGLPLYLQLPNFLLDCAQLTLNAKASKCGKISKVDWGYKVFVQGNFSCVENTTL